MFLQLCGNWRRGTSHQTLRTMGSQGGVGAATGDGARPQYRVYGRRWLVLLCFCLLSVGNQIPYGTFTTISSEVRHAFRVCVPTAPRCWRDSGTVYHPQGLQLGADGCGAWLGLALCRLQARVAAFGD